MNFSPVDWNNPDQAIDLEVWNRMTGNFWLPEKIALSNDLPSWRRLDENKQRAVVRAFAGLTVLDTLQAEVGAGAVAKHARSHHESANMAFIGGMEAIHARSYSSIFATLVSSEQNKEAFEWASENKWLQAQANIVNNRYEHLDPYWTRVHSVMLESFLFYTGFYPALRLVSEGSLPNTADIIRLIMRDEGVHGFYIGLKAQAIRPLHMRPSRVTELVSALMHPMVPYVQELYEGTGWTEDVIKFAKYNANKALTNLGEEPYFPDNETNVSPQVLAQMVVDANETHDFFSGSGSSYVMGKAEEISEDEWGSM